jgi:hypothetical protein
MVVTTASSACPFFVSQKIQRSSSASTPHSYTLSKFLKLPSYTIGSEDQDEIKQVEILGEHEA